MPLRAKPDLVRERKAVCAACPHAVRGGPRQIVVRCGLCGCPIVSKTMFQRARCPAGKW